MNGPTKLMTMTTMTYSQITMKQNALTGIVKKFKHRNVNDVKSPRGNFCYLALMMTPQHAEALDSSSEMSEKTP